MGSQSPTYRIPRFILWAGRLFLVLLIAASVPIIAGRIAYAGRFGCLQYGKYIIDIGRNKEFALSRAPTLPDPDQQYPSPNGKYIAHLKYSRIYNAYYLTISDANGGNERQIAKQQRPIAFQGWSEDSQYFQSKTLDDLGLPHVEIWRTATLQPVLQLNTDGGGWSPTGHELAYAIKGELRIVNPENKVERSYSLPLSENSSETKWSPDAKFVAIKNQQRNPVIRQEAIYTVVNLNDGKYFQHSSGNFGDYYDVSLWGNWMGNSNIFAFLQLRQAGSVTTFDLMGINAVSGSLNVIVSNIVSMTSQYLWSPFYYSIPGDTLVYVFMDNGKLSAGTLNAKTGQRYTVLSQVDRLVRVRLTSDGTRLVTAYIKNKNTTDPDRIQIFWSRLDGIDSHSIDI